MPRNINKHYRVAKKEIDNNKTSKKFNVCAKKRKFIFIGIAFVLIVFLKGLFFGYLYGKNN